LISNVPDSLPDHYATLGLDRRCTTSQIRSAYRSLAAKFHPDRNGNSTSASRKMQALNEAHETLSDPTRRQIYNRDLDDHHSRERPGAGSRKSAIRQDAFIPLRGFFRGMSLEVRVNDPSNLEGAETYHLEVPADTAPGARFRIARTKSSNGGMVDVRVKALPNHHFKARGSDLRCDLRVSLDRVTKGGVERIQGPTDRMIPVAIPPRVSRGEIIRVSGEGLPKARGGRGDLLVRIIFRPTVQVSQRSR
jgi:curved DNA-binding protein